MLYKLKPQPFKPKEFKNVSSFNLLSYLCHQITERKKPEQSF